MKATFEQALNAAAILGNHAYERDALFNELSRERGEAVEYRTFYGWCRTLKIPSGLPLYSAEQVLLLLTLVWARFRKRYKNLNRQSIKELSKNYANYRTYRAA